MTINEVLIQEGAIAGVIAGLITAIKTAGMPTKYLPILSWLMGGIIGTIIASITAENLIAGFIWGVLAATAANAGYDQYSTLKKAKTK